jgi:RNA polymerase sigma-70 factor (ECF subfamily)
MTLDTAKSMATAHAPAFSPPASGRERLSTASGPAAAAERRADLAMDRYAGGDETAFSQLFSELSPRLRAFLRRLTGSEELTEDLLQETFLRMHHGRSGFVRGNGVAQWAYTIARNGYISQCRSTRARLTQASEGAEALEGVAGNEGTSEQQAVARQTAHIVERALLDMTAAQREAFMLLRCEGLSMSKAAQRLGASKGAVKIRLFRASSAIRRALAAPSRAWRPPSSE